MSEKVVAPGVELAFHVDPKAWEIACGRTKSGTSDDVVDDVKFIIRAAMLGLFGYEIDVQAKEIQPS
jgi:hypothetical protein